MLMTWNPLKDGPMPPETDLSRPETDLVGFGRTWARWRGGSGWDQDPRPPEEIAYRSASLTSLCAASANLRGDEILKVAALVCSLKLL